MPCTTSRYNKIYSLLSRKRTQMIIIDARGSLIVHCTLGKMTACPPINPSVAKLQDLSDGKWPITASRGQCTTAKPEPNQNQNNSVCRASTDMSR